MNEDDAQERWVELEVKLAFVDEMVKSLHEALVDKERRVSVLEDEVDRLKRALRVVAERTRPADEVIGALPEEDPVPRSG